MRRQALDQPEQAFRVVRHRHARVQRRAAQTAPQRFHPGRERHGARCIALVQQNARHLPQPREFVRAQRLLRGWRFRRLGRFGRGVEQTALQPGARCGRGRLNLRRDAQGAFQQDRHRRDVVVAKQTLQGRQRQAAVRCAQHRQPGETVAGMGQGPHQLHQIRDHRPQRQGHQVHRAAADAFLRQPAGQIAQMAARPHQHRDRMPGALVIDERLAHQPHRDVLGLRFRRRRALARPSRVEAHSRFRQRLVESGGGAVGDGARGGVAAPGQQFGERLVHPVHDAGLRTEVVGQV
ncbi:hypothetical protein FQZ97_474750 [compost metagenome]